jgi:hypothetical protein
MSTRKKTTHKKQKLYKMKGCSHKKSHKKTHKKYHKRSHRKYLGKGGDSDLNRAFPNRGPTPSGYNFLNSQVIRGGGCGSCGITPPQQMGGVQMGGNGNGGIPYPNGLTGSPTIPGNISTWPGVRGVSGDNNHYSLNTYRNDVPNQMITTGAQFPFTGFKGGRRYKKSGKKCGKSKKGGSISNLLFQDLVNLGRQVSYNSVSSNNAMAGKAAPVNPMPWKDQLTHSRR